MRNKTASMRFLNVALAVASLSGCAFVTSIKERPEFAGMVGREVTLENDEVLVEQHGLKWLHMVSPESTGSDVRGVVEAGTRLAAVDVISYESVGFSWYFAIARIENGKRAGEKVATSTARFTAPR